MDSRQLREMLPRELQLPQRVRAEEMRKGGGARPNWGA